MNNNRLSENILFPRPFILLPGDKNMALKQKRLLRIVTIATIILSGIILLYISRLNFLQVAMVVTIELLFAINVYFFFLRRKKAPGNYSLEIDLDEISLHCDDKIVQNGDIKNLVVDQLGWGENRQNCLPLIRLSGDNFPEIIIAAPDSENLASPSKKFRMAADFHIVNDAEWQRMIRTLYGLSGSGISDSLSEYKQLNTIKNEVFAT
jgi:hypothetical protein